MKGNVEDGTPDKLWIVAGENNIKTTQYIYANGTVEFGPEIPNGDEAPCLVGLDNGDAFLLGTARPVNDATEGSTQVVPMCASCVLPKKVGKIV